MATYNYVVKYWVEAECVTPLRTSGADNETEQLLVDGAGNPMIQGNSIAGAFRYWIQSNIGVDAANNLFGDQQKEGKLVISDGIFHEGTARTLRPRVCLNGSTGGVENKFDVLLNASGSVMSFTVTWLGEKKDVEQIQWLEQMLAAMDQGQIRLGAFKSSGFGVLKLTVKRQSYDMFDVAQRNNWLKDIVKAEIIRLPELKIQSQIEFLVRGTLDNVLVKASNLEREGKESVTVNLKENGIPILPGTSIKGVIRARVETIAQLLEYDMDIVDNMFGRGALGEDTGKAGTVYFQDVKLEKNTKQKITRIRINKFTGGVMYQAMMKEEPVHADVCFSIQMKNEPKQCLLMLYALRDLGLGLYNLGSGYAIGRGFLNVNEICVNDGKDSKFVMRFMEDGQYVSDDPQGLLKSWQV